MENHRENIQTKLNTNHVILTISILGREIWCLVIGIVLIIIMNLAQVMVLRGEEMWAAVCSGRSHGEACLIRFLRVIYTRAAAPVAQGHRINWGGHKGGRGFILLLHPRLKNDPKAASCK